MFSNCSYPDTAKRNAYDSPLPPLVSSVSCSPIVAVSVPVIASIDTNMLKQSLRFPMCKVGDNIGNYTVFAYCAWFCFPSCVLGFFQESAVYMEELINYSMNVGFEI